MAFSTVLTLITFLSTTGWAQYVLEDDYFSGGDFFDKFSFWNTSDPTQGCVDYQDLSTASLGNLTKVQDNGQIYMGVDYETKAPSNGRGSVRLTSTKSYNSGLVIVDLEHMPGGICGTWPAFWMVGPDWPTNGEIDIIEGVNDQTANDMTLHTGPGCSISTDADMSGTISTSNCDINAPGQQNNAGCQIKTSNTQTYGSGFNANKGGVYATEWTDSAIKIYFFPRGSIPDDIAKGSPNPSGWGKPMSVFQGDCDISNTFKDLQIVFDTTFCGDWAGDTWASSSCAQQASTCDAFVSDNPGAFKDAYWTVNSLKVYQSNGGSQSSSSIPSYSTPTPYSVSNIVSASPPYSANSSKTVPAYPTQASVTAPAGSAPAYSAPAPASTSSSNEWESPWHHHWTKTAWGVPRAAEPTGVANSAPEDFETQGHEHGHFAHETQSVEANAALPFKAGEEGRSHISTQRLARHLRQHKRHGSGRL